MPNPTIRELVSTFTEEELDLSFPIDFQDISEEDVAIVNQYNTYLSNGDYTTAKEYRTENTVLEKYIFDAKKMNLLQAMVVNSYLYAKEERDANNIGFTSTGELVSTNIGDAIHELEDITNVIENTVDDMKLTTEANVSKINGVKVATLTVDGWEGTEAPYTQTVDVEGVIEGDNPILVSMLEDGADITVQKAYTKAFGIIVAGTGTTSDGSVTFNVYKKPTTTITVGLKGV